MDSFHDDDDGSVSAIDHASPDDEPKEVIAKEENKVSQSGSWCSFCCDFGLPANSKSLWVDARKQCICLNSLLTITLLILRIVGRELLQVDRLSGLVDYNCCGGDWHLFLCSQGSTKRF